MNTFSTIKEVGMAFLYLFICILTTGFLGCYLYKIFFLKRISLKEELFKQDNLSVWLEFIYGFLAPVFFLISVIIAPNGKFVYQGNSKDLLVLIIYITAYIFVFCLFRFLAEVILNAAAKIKFGEKFILSQEIFINNNLAVSFISISTSVVVTSMMLQENILFEHIYSNIIRILTVAFLNIGLISLYTRFVLPEGKSIFKDIFIVHNTSSGILLLGNIIAINIIITSVINFFKLLGINWLNISNLIDLILFNFFVYIFMMVFIAITKKILSWIVKVDVEDEIFNKRNIGYVLFESSFYILLSFIVINVFLIN
ncbi:MAG: hypothetical protein ACM3KR_06335 [Deltaproteobacteria bacterium]